MKTSAQDGSPQSLGELVSGLRPGRPCPWCGGVLKVDRTVRCIDADSPCQEADKAERPLLYCDDCGSEVYLCGAETGAHQQGRLGAAA